MSGGNMEGCSGASQITSEFVKSLETQLKINNSALEDSIKEYETSNSMLFQEIHFKCSKLKSMKKEVSNSKSKIEELRKSLQDFKQSSKELSEYTSLLKADIESYDKESIAWAEEHNKCLEKADAKWKIHKEEYEQRPAAVRLRKEEVELKKSEIELMVKRYKLAEKKKMFATLDAINKKQRNDLAIESATIWKEACLEERKRNETLERQKKLRIEIQRQEAKIKELTQAKREAMSKAQQKSSLIKGKRVADHSTTMQFQRLKIPRKTMLRQMPNLWNNNSDNISISSTLIDEIIEPFAKPKETEDDKLDRSDQLSQRREASQTKEIVEAGLLEKLNDMQIKNKASAETSEVANRCYSNSEDLRNVDTTEMQVEDDAEIMEGDERVDRSMEGKERETRKTIENKEEINILSRRSQESMNRPEYEITYRRFYREPEINNDKISAASQEAKPPPPEREIQGRNAIGQPIIKNIETVEFNLPLWKSAARMPKAVDEDSTRNDGELSSEFSWKRSNRPESLNTVGDSQRGDVELDSILGSQISLQSEEMMERLRLALDSPELGINKDKDSVLPNENDRRADLSHIATDGFTNNRSPTASPFLGIGNYGSTPANRDREDKFFMNMF